MSPDTTLLLCDAYSLIYRAYYAIRNLTTPEGKPANAIYGFAKMLGKLRQDYSPTHLAIVFDLGAPKDRLEILPEYKAHRPPTPPDLDAQLPTIRKLLPAMGLAVVEQEGEEADDIIASFTESATQRGIRVLIATSDKDLFQLVNESVNIISGNSSGSTLIDNDAVMRRYAVRPDQMVDFLSLVGDSVDNIKGVPGIGEKTAANLLNKYGSIYELIKNADKIEKQKLRTVIVSNIDRLKKNQSLISLRKNLKLPTPIEKLRIHSEDTKKLQFLYHQLGFKTLLSEIENRRTDQGELFKSKH